MPDTSFSLQRLALAALGPPRVSSLEALAARIGMAVVCTEHPIDRARLAADCLVRLLEHPALAGAETPRGLMELSRSASRAPALEHRAFDSAFLRSLPVTAGIYRFHAADGRLLYVGKARNLRRRVGSYFAARDRPDPRTAGWLDGVHAVEFEETASEPEALLREAALIARASPAENRQRTVRERPAPRSQNLILLLPAGRSKEVSANLIRDGAVSARVRLGPRGGGKRQLFALLKETYFARSETPKEGTTPAPAAPSRGRRHAAGRRDGLLLDSWLARQDGPVASFDPTDASGPREALALALRYAESVRRGETGIIYRDRT